MKGNFFDKSCVEDIRGKDRRGMEHGQIESVREKVTGQQESRPPEEAEQVGDGRCRGQN